MDDELNPLRSQRTCRRAACGAPNHRRPGGRPIASSQLLLAAAVAYSVRYLIGLLSGFNDDDATSKTARSTRVAGKFFKQLPGAPVKPPTNAQNGYGFFGRPALPAELPG